jgi:hypothetical protein
MLRQENEQNVQVFWLKRAKPITLVAHSPMQGITVTIRRMLQFTEFRAVYLQMQRARRRCLHSKRWNENKTCRSNAAFTQELTNQQNLPEVFTRVRNALADMFEVPAAVQRLTGGLSATPMHPLSPGESPQEAMSDRPGGRSLEDMLQQLQSMMRTREAGFVSAEQSYVLQTELLRQLEELRAAMMMVDIIVQDFEVGVVEQRLVRVHDRQRIVQLEQERESLLGLMEKEVSRNIQSTEVQLTALRGSVVKVSERFPF